MMENDHAKNIIQSFFLTTYIPGIISYYSYVFKGERTKPTSLFSEITAWRSNNISIKNDPQQGKTHVQVNSCT